VNINSFALLLGGLAPAVWPAPREAPAMRPVPVPAPAT